MYKRNITESFTEALEDTPILLVNGSRQVGKSTFVKSLLSDTHQYYTLDDPTTLASIRKDPLMFLEGLQGPSIIDEVQRVPELFLPLKKIVDHNRKPGFFVLTGSVLSLPKLADSLAGRMEVHTLWPMSQGEIHGRKEDFIGYIFTFPITLEEKAEFMGITPRWFKKRYIDPYPPPSPQTKLPLAKLTEMITQGGYPETLHRSSSNRRKKWFASYLMTILEKDIKDLANIEGLLELPNLLKLFASRCGGLLNTSEVSRSLGIAQTTLKRYLALLERTYLLVLLPAWTKNLSKRIVKTPKVYLNDTGLLTHLVDYEHNRLLNDKGFLGHVLENFVVMELKKQMTWSQQSCQIYHYRTHSHQEVDIILEAPDSRIVAIEVKLANVVTSKDFSGIQSLEDDLGDRFHRGIILYMGDTAVSFGKNKYAIPLSYLWETTML
jgi:predicted AAA+ superfamily ATPase